MTQGKFKSDGELDFADGDESYDKAVWNNTHKAIPPIGSLIAIDANITGSQSIQGTNWVECDGSVVSDSDSPLNGVTLPDLNGQDKYLRGNSTSGSTGGSSGSHSHEGATTNGTSNVFPYADFSGGSSAWVFYGDATPPYYDIKLYIRIK